MPAKRAKKKTARKRTARKKPARRRPPSHRRKTRWLLRFLVLCAVAVGAVTGVYYFASFETREKMERSALGTINGIRTHESTPSLFAALLDTIYDTIPSSGGLVVEGSELGREAEAPFLAGIPNSRFPIRVLAQPSYVNLFNEASRQSACVAIRLDGSRSERSQAETSIIADSRIPRLDAASMTLGQWAPYPLAPAKALVRQHGDRGAGDARLASNFVPMTASFYEDIWQRVMRELTQRYPKRFEEVWLCLGPLYRPESSKLASGIAVPDALYAIAFDLTDEGGLRALALIIPADAESVNLNTYLTSIAQIEKLSGLQFLPEIDFSVRDTLIHYISPSVW
jgi:DNA/RNA endonuclease G (NUC1)